MRYLRFGQSTAISLRSKPLHWILSPRSWDPTSSRQWTMFSTMIFSKVRKASLGQCLNTPGLRLRGLLLPRNIVSKLGQQLAENCYSYKQCVSTTKIFTYCREFLVRRASVENFCKFSICSVLITEYLFESSCSKDQVSKTVDIWTGFQNHTSTIPFHLILFGIIYIRFEYAIFYNIFYEYFLKWC